MFTSIWAGFYGNQRLLFLCKLSYSCEIPDVDAWVLFKKSTYS